MDNLKEKNCARQNRFQDPPKKIFAIAFQYASIFGEDQGG